MEDLVRVELEVIVVKVVNWAEEEGLEHQEEMQDMLMSVLKLTESKLEVEELLLASQRHTHS